MNLDDKIAIVNCGASGVGKEIVRCLLQNEIRHVVIFDINLLQAKRTCDELCLKYGQGRAIHLNIDLTIEWEFASALQKIKHEFKRIDILVNNADIYNSTDVTNNNLVNTNQCTEIAIKFLEPDAVVVDISKLDTLPLNYSNASLRVYTKAISHLELSRLMRVHILKSGFSDIDTLSEFLRAESMSPENMNNGLTDTVGRMIVYLIKYGKNGATYAISDGKIRKLNNENDRGGEVVPFE